MAPIKLEDNIKQKLEERTIVPSDALWDKLEQKLESKTSKRNKLFWSLGVAATVIGVFLAVTILFKEQKIEVVPTVVEKPLEVESKKQEQEIIKMDKVVEEQVALSKTDKEEIQKSKMSQLVTNQNKKNDLAKEQQELLEKNVVEIKGDNNQQDVALNQIESLEARQKALNNEVDKLLEQAKVNVQAHKINTNNTKVVDASALLESVDNELEESFRDKVFEVLKTGFKNVKTAVAERND